MVGMDIEEVNSLIDDYKVLLESYRKENKHLRELQRNMDKQYEKLEYNWNELKEWLEKNVIDSKTTSGLNYYFRQVLNFMSEIESGKND